MVSAAVSAMKWRARLGALSMLGLAATAALTPPAQADSFLLHLDGEVGDRRAYFVDMLVTDRTPVSLEPQKVEIKELATTIVYENAEMPELIQLNLQFECVGEFYYAYHNKTPPKAPQWEPVRTRVAQGSVLLRRADLKTEPVPSGDWEVSAELPMLKARQLACNEQKINEVIRDATTDGEFRRASFEAKFPALGLETLTGGILVTSLSLWSEYIDLTWTKFWPDAVHPDPSGKWSRASTPEEIAEYERKLASVNQQLTELSNQTRSAYEPKVQEMQDKFAFEAEAEKLRGGRKARPFETDMLKLWQGKSEDVVVATMGRPDFFETDRLHLLSYYQVFDNRVTVGSSTGEVWEEGLFTECEVQFVTMADAGGTYRVADIVLSIDSSNIMATDSRTACGDLKVAPRD